MVIEGIERLREQFTSIRFDRVEQRPAIEPFELSEEGQRCCRRRCARLRRFAGLARVRCLRIVAASRLPILRGPRMSGEPFT